MSPFSANTTESVAHDESSCDGAPVLWELGTPVRFNISGEPSRGQAPSFREPIGNLHDSTGLIERRRGLQSGVYGSRCLPSRFPKQGGW